MKDQHVHSNISHDGVSGIREYMDKAPEMGIDEITFTEHYDDYVGVDAPFETLDVSYYYDEYFKIKNDDKLKTNFGIEIGLQPDITESVLALAKEYPFDFIIGSSHVTCKKDISSDKSFFEGCSRHEAYMKYFNEVLENVKIYDCFDVYGHLDYVVRYGNYAEKKIEYNEFREVLDEILKTLISKGKGIEINTSGIRYGLGYPHPHIELLKRYKELGGEIITVGSDAHKACDLGSNFDIAYDILSEAGFKNIAVYHGRKPEFISLEEEKYGCKK